MIGLRRSNPALVNERVFIEIYNLTAEKILMLGQRSFTCLLLITEVDFQE